MAVIPDDWFWMWSDLRVSLPGPLASIRENVRNSKPHGPVCQSHQYFLRRTSAWPFTLRGKPTGRENLCMSNERPW